MAKFDFKVVAVSLPPLAYNLPVDKYRRAALYSYFNSRQVALPDYAGITRDNLHPEDLAIFDKTFRIKFRYNGGIYRLAIAPGAVFDFASVPKVFTHGTLSKRGQHVDIAAAVHDCLFALNLLPYEDANNVFIGLIDWLDLASPLARRLYAFGVNTRKGKRIYDSSNPETHWLKDYVTFQKVGSYEV